MCVCVSVYGWCDWVFAVMFFWVVFFGISTPVFVCICGKEIYAETSINMGSRRWRSKNACWPRAYHIKLVLIPPRNDIICFDEDSSLHRKRLIHIPKSFKVYESPQTHHTRGIWQNAPSWLWRCAINRDIPGCVAPCVNRPWPFGLAFERCEVFAKVPIYTHTRKPTRHMRRPFVRAKVSHIRRMCRREWCEHILQSLRWILLRWRALTRGWMVSCVVNRRQHKCACWIIFWRDQQCGSNEIQLLCFSVE